MAFDNSKLEKNILRLAELILNSTIKVVRQEQEALIKDYDTTLKMVVDSQKEDENKKLYLTEILDGHMDTMVKVVINLVVMALTECALEETNITVNLPDIAEYISNHKEEYNLN